MISLLFGIPLALGQVVMDRFETFQNCPLNLPVTCTNSTPVENECCFESPGGIILQTQFWDYYPAIGDADAFTLHGLWPDKCDGTFDQFCNGLLNIAKGDIQYIIENQFQNKELFAQLTKSWKNFNGDDEQLWIHEFNKHATCVKTLRPECYGPNFKRNQNVYDFFKIAVDLYNKYPTFQYLDAAGIKPSTSQTYTRAQIDSALRAGFGGHKVFFKCNRYQALQEVWYYHNLRGPLSSQQFVQIDAIATTNCPKEGIKFFPKGKYVEKPKDPKPKDPNDPTKFRGHLTPVGLSGCLIGKGSWYQQGPCAVFRVEESQFGGQNIVSAKGVCGINNDGEIFCNKKNQRSQYQFSYDKAEKTLSYGGKSDWCFNYEHKQGDGCFEQIPVMLSNGNCNSFKLKLVE